MNSTLFKRDSEKDFFGHVDEDYFYLENNLNEKVLVFVPEVVYDSGQVNTEKVQDVQNEDVTLEELLAADVLYLIESPSYSPQEVADLLEEATGEYRNFYILRTAQ